MFGDDRAIGLPPSGKVRDQTSAKPAPDEPGPDETVAVLGSASAFNPAPVTRAATANRRAVSKARFDLDVVMPRFAALPYFITVGERWARPLPLFAVANIWRSQATPQQADGAWSFSGVCVQPGVFVVGRAKSCWPV